MKLLNHRKDLILEALKVFRSKCKNNNELKAQFAKNNEEAKPEFSELKKCNKESTDEFKEQATTKLEETNTRIGIFEARVEQSLNEQILKTENRFKGQKAGRQKELKDNVKQLTECWNERLKISNQEQDMKIKTVSEQVGRTQELKVRTTRLKTVMVESTKTTILFR